MMHNTEALSIKQYFYIVSKVLGEPKNFFESMPPPINWKYSLFFLSISSFFYAIAGVISGMVSPPIKMLVIFFINAIGMTFIYAGIGYIIMSMVRGRTISFMHFFTIYALASGVTLLASWMPYFIIFTEPWKWYLIGLGLIKSCGFNKKHTIIIILFSIISIYLLFISFSPIILSLKAS